MPRFPLATLPLCCFIASASLIAQPTQVMACFGERVILTAPAGFATYDWSPTTGLGTTQGETVSFTALQDFAYVVASRQVSGPNLVANPDFAAGNSGFSSAYRHVPDGTNDQGAYAILRDPRLFNANFQPCTDPSTPNGAFLVADGSTRSGDEVWCQRVSVRSDATYAFSALLTALVAENPPRLAFSIDGVTLGTLAATGTTCQWQDFYAVWQAGASSQAEICILNINTAPSGNDFGLDDISLTELTAARLDTFLVTVVPPISTSITVPLCGDARYQANGLNLAAGSSGVARLMAASGCDSTLTVATVALDTIIERARIDTLCPGETVTYEGNQFTADTTICRLYRSQMGCDSTYCLTLKFLDEEALVADMNRPSCPGDADGSIAVRSTAGLRPLTYRWDDGVTDSVRTGLAAGDYTLSVTDAKGCVATRVFTLSDPPAIEILDVLTLGVRCFGETTGFALVDATGGTGELSFEGIRGGQSFSLDTLTQGRYTLRVTDSLGCFAESMFDIEGPSQVTASVRGDTLVKLGVLGSYRAQISGDNVQTFWTYNDVSVDSLVVGDELTFRPPGDGELVVRAVDTNGCVATDRINIRLQPLDTEFFPSAFSPNGDGINDTFGPVPDPSLAEIVRFDVFDRWGGHLYGLANCPLSGPGRPCDWTGRPNGSDDGKQYDIGVYAYYAKLRLIDGRVIERKGDVSLFR